MTRPDMPASGRRAVLAGACCAALAGCTRYDSGNGLAAQPAQQYPSAPAAPADANTPVILARTADIPVGGGAVLTGRKIVITQPHAGSFHAFTAICTHQGCIVATVSGGTINCPCHGSKYSIVDGSVANGPAALPLAAVSITVQGTSIIQA